MKRCSKCTFTKPYSEFQKNSRARDGLNFWCRQCYQKYYQEHKARIAAYKREQYQLRKDTPEYAAKVKENRKKYNDAHRELTRERSKQYRENNKEKLKEYEAARYQLRRDYQLQKNKEYAAKKKASQMSNKLSKDCTHCKLTKPFPEFYKNSSKKDGLSNWCKSCTKAYRETEAYKEYIHEYNHQRYLYNRANNPEIYAKSCESKRAWEVRKRAEDPDFFKKRGKEYRENNKEKIRAYELSRHESKREYNKIWLRNNRAKKKAQQEITDGQ